MNRRSVLKSLGATTIAGSAVLGSGALTQVTAQRNVDISVTSDSASAVKLSAGDAATGGFADISESNGQLGFSTSDINAGGQLVVGSAGGNDPSSNVVSSTAFEITDNASLGTNEAMGLDVSVSSDSGNSGLGLIFLPKSGSDDLANDAATGGLGYATGDQDSVAGAQLVSGGSGTFPSLPSRYDTSNDSARFLLDSISTVGAELLVQADPSDSDDDASTTDASFTVTVTAETVDTSTTS